MNKTVLPTQEDSTLEKGLKPQYSRFRKLAEENRSDYTRFYGIGGVQ